jgi:hypothetical protein
MERTYLFECAGCGYRTHVSGGADRSEHIAVQTILCADCRALYDAVIEFEASQQKGNKKENNPKTAPGFAAVLNRLPPRGKRKWIKFNLACPISPLHRVRVWKRPDKCPKCGTHLEPNGRPFRIWD